MDYDQKIEHQNGVIKNLRFLNESNVEQNEKLISEISLLEKKINSQNYENENRIKNLVKLNDDLQQQNKELTDYIEKLVSIKKFLNRI